MVADEVALQIYLNSPCPESTTCDKVITRLAIPPGAFLVIAGGLIFVAGKIVLGPAHAPAT